MARGYGSVAAIVVPAICCAGCFGFLVDKPRTTDIQNPAPLKARQFPFSFGEDRWACQQSADPERQFKKDDFVSAWGEPTEKVTTAKGETWI